MDSVVIVRALSAMLMPPLNLLLLAAVGGVLWLLGRRRIAAALVTVSLLTLWLLSTPAVAFWMMRTLTADVPSLTNPRAANAQAIVILGSGRRFNALEYGGSDQPGLHTLGRLRYGAWLHEQTGLPILVSGGSPERRPGSEAGVMARSLLDNFKAPVRWMESESDNTEQNARFSARMLRQAGITRILLVSDAWHLPRSVPMFAGQGMQVIAAPTNGLEGDATSGYLQLLPQAYALSVSQIALHEWVGMAWYRLRH